MKLEHSYPENRLRIPLLHSNPFSMEKGVQLLSIKRIPILKCLTPLLFLFSIDGANANDFHKLGQNIQRQKEEKQQFEINTLDKNSLPEQFEYTYEIVYFNKYLDQEQSPFRNLTREILEKIFEDLSPPEIISLGSTSKASRNLFLTLYETLRPFTVYSWDSLSTVLQKLNFIDTYAPSPGDFEKYGTSPKAAYNPNILGSIAAAKKHSTSPYFSWYGGKELTEKLASTYDVNLDVVKQKRGMGSVIALQKDSYLFWFLMGEGLIGTTFLFGIDYQMLAIFWTIMHLYVIVIAKA